MARIGLNAKLYRGTAGTTPATEMTNIKDLSAPDERDEADISVRGSEYDLMMPTTRKLEISFRMNWDETDADFAAILAAYNARTALAFKCLSASTGQGPMFDGCVMKLSKEEPRKGAIEADVTIKPTYVSRYPSWVS